MIPGIAYHIFVYTWYIISGAVFSQQLHGIPRTIGPSLLILWDPVRSWFFLPSLWFFAACSWHNSNSNDVYYIYVGPPPSPAFLGLSNQCVSKVVLQCIATCCWINWWRCNWVLLSVLFFFCSAGGNGPRALHAYDAVVFLLSVKRRPLLFTVNCWLLRSRSNKGIPPPSRTDLHEY